MRIILLISLLSIALSFPVQDLSVTQEQFAKLNAPTPDVALANSLLTKALQPFFQKNLVEVLKTDITFTGTYPNTVVSDHCSLDHPKVTAEDNKLKGTLLANSYMNASLAIKWDEVEAMMNADLKAQLEVDTKLEVEEKQKVFGHCKKIASDHFNMVLKSTGDNKVGVLMKAEHITIKKENGTWNLEFDFNITIVGEVIKWNVDEFKVSGGCKIEVFHWKIADFCGYVSDKAKVMIQKFENTVSDVDAPALLKRIQDKIQTAVGTRVKIPLKLPSEQVERAITLEDIIKETW